MSTIRERVEVGAKDHAEKVHGYRDHKYTEATFISGADLAMRLIVEELRSVDARAHEAKILGGLDGELTPHEWASWLEARWTEKGKE